MDARWTRVQPGPGDVAVLLSAPLDGVGATLSVAALHTVKPADLLAVELGDGALVLLGAAAWTTRLRRRGAVRQLLLGAFVPGVAFLLGDLDWAGPARRATACCLAVEPLLSVLLAVAFLRERLPLRAAVALPTPGRPVPKQPALATSTTGVAHNRVGVQP